MDNIVVNIVTGFSVFPYIASFVTLAFSAATVVKNRVDFVKLPIKISSNLLTKKLCKR